MTEAERLLERDQFRVGFREGLEYQLEALYRQGSLSEPHHMQYGPLQQRNRRKKLVLRDTTAD